MIEQFARALKQYWGYDSFLPMQRRAMECIAQGRDSMVILPTGGGKSVCFQAPAVALPGMAVVISPLISLMKDQVDALAECGVSAGRLDSSLAFEERRAVIGRVRAGTLKLLYVSPERVLGEWLIELLGQVNLSLIAVDEAHCISMWGHDFRPEYAELGRLKETFPKVPIHAFTATATDRVRRDIAERLSLREPELLVGSFDRPNLVYSVQRRGNRLEQVRAVIERYRGESGIIYCIRRADVDTLCGELRGAGYRALPYHAGMEDEERRRNQDAFIRDEATIIVATVAFGMGIDKSNVRYVVHAGMPKSIEHYQQESGRAGRDGLEAECVLLWSGADFGVWKHLLGNIEDPLARKIATGKLGEMYDYCNGVGCRHQALVAYFGQSLRRANCAACDICLGGLEPIAEPLDVARKILCSVARQGGAYDVAHTAAVVTGTPKPAVVEAGHDALSTFGLLEAHPRPLVREWIEQLAAQGCLSKDLESGGLTLTPAGWRVIRAEETPRLLAPAPPREEAKVPAKVARPTEEGWAGVDEGLYEVLRRLRKGLAEERKVPAYVIFGDATLRELARRRPSDRENLLAVSGIGERKAGQYGEIFLAVIRQHCIEHGLALDMDFAAV